MFIEINKDTTINSSEVCWITRNEIGCIIYVGGQEYPSDIPYETIVMLLKSDNKEKAFEKLDQFLSVATIQTP